MTRYSINFVTKQHTLKTIASLGVSLLITHVCMAQTWNQDIAPIVYDHCGKCHHYGGIAPNSLVTYSEAALESAAMESAILSGEMPPWPANPEYSHFVGENVLTASDEQAILNWIANGAPEGTGSAPPIPSYNDGYVIGTPDEIVQVPAYTVGSNDDEYRSFVVQSTSDVERFIGGIEFEPGNTEIVHHILAFYDPTNTSQQLDAASPGEGFPSNGGSFPSDQAVLIGVWVPGMEPTIFLHSLAIPIPGGADFVFEVHYAPGSIGQNADIHMRIDYKDDLFIRTVYHDPLLFHGPPSLTVPLFIPANTVQTFHETSIQAPIDISLISVFPHMHLLGQEFKVFGVTATNDTIPVIHVDDWDFHWQYSYQMPNMIRLPQGSRLHGYATYDNTPNNPENPNSPPIDVGLGEGTEDEMMVCFFMYTPYLNGDENLDMVQVREPTLISEPLLTYPNPTASRLWIDIPNNWHHAPRVLATDMQGRSTELTSTWQYGRIELNTESLAAGSYHLQFVYDQQIRTTRFIKQ
jgi:hypothetical protein